MECSAEEGLFSPALCLEARGGTGQFDGSRERQEQAPSTANGPGLGPELWPVAGGLRKSPQPANHKPQDGGCRQGRGESLILCQPPQRPVDRYGVDQTILAIQQGCGYLDQPHPFHLTQWFEGIALRTSAFMMQEDLYWTSGVVWRSA